MTVMRTGRRVLRVLVIAAAALSLGASAALFGVCGPFTDVTDAAFCPFVLEIFTLGITTGTSPTTYDPATTVNRLQMAAFLSRTVDAVIKRGGRRAPHNQFWTSSFNAGLGTTTVGTNPLGVVHDGADLWVANAIAPSVSRVRASDGKLLETWTGVFAPRAVMLAMGRVVIAGGPSIGTLWTIDPSQAAGVATTVASNLGPVPIDLTFDGARVWTANQGPGSLSIVTPGATIPWTVTTVTTGFTNAGGVVYDGKNVWLTDRTAGTLLKLDSAGAILQTVTVGSGPNLPLFDGTNIWVPNNGTDDVSVVRASTGAVLQTLTGNGLDNPVATAFDGERVLVTSISAGASAVSLWKAADLKPLGFAFTGPSTFPEGACSDGLNFVQRQREARALLDRAPRGSGGSGYHRRRSDEGSDQEVRLPQLAARTRRAAAGARRAGALSRA